ncbi:MULTISPECIES: CDP-alcohol phosphatidyltransferase family protein [Photobacterium]|uniref:Membrane protein n=1 Tax=Photobacterium ganghwense TaxID=320778 RepID=A0A0J1HAX7_9GAMM|nr:MULTISPECIES: CDP-alcohol phosphatidyltransferase family protein [Photobacterium]KLV08803.1 membrane protein [Photobacterium ganghwense]MBV1841181.1 CDP-alcohol phosphatidyltransferase family protein [Photobacterium ganghwense]PSU11640.1 CDP-alcohol phosphatidyltransferase family protein [Photobacterium ganghwense]QSV12963.1 CDP-alcohol phosphatidyltransferase family protein [Photobacterium ganghwense]
MLDKYSIKVIKWPLNTLAVWPDKLGITANQVTISGFLIGLLALPALAWQQYEWALACILLNRIFDGLDGAIARRQGITDCGGFLDITLDFLFYSLVPFGFVLANPEANAVAGAFLIFSFIGTGSSFLSFAIMASKRNIESPVYKQKSLYYLGGLTEGTETIACFVLCCLLPQHFALIAWVFGSLCWFTTGTRILAGYQTLKQE